MAQGLPCPDTSVLMRLARGELLPEEQTRVQAHVEQCPTCAATVARSLLGSAEDTTALPDQRVLSSAEKPLARGTNVGRYVVLDPLGAGGMGVVYAGYDPELDRKVALKLLQLGFGPSSSSGQTWLLREAQAMARLSHPNVVAVYDAGIWQDRVFMAMEFVEGMTVRQWLDERPRTWREAVGIFLLAGRGLAAAHAAGLVHHDFKPDNVLVGKDGRVRVMDFGLARQIRSEGHAAAKPPQQPMAASTGELPDAEGVPSGSVIGTPRYMAPEQLRGEPADERSDQFSYCVALYQAVYREAPFAGTGRALVTEVLKGNLREPPKKSGVPAWVSRVVMRGLSARPLDRYPSMDALLADLSRDPAVARRRWLTAAGVGLLAVGGIAGVLQLVSSREARCAGAERKLAGVWDAERAGLTRKAFLATGAAYAEDAWHSVERTMNRYAQDWSAARTEVCVATLVAGGDPEASTPRMECLEQRRQEMNALVDIFQQSAAATLEHAVTAVQSLTPPGECNRAELQPSAPVSPERAARLSSLRAQLGRAKSLLDTARFQEGLQVAEEAHRQALAESSPELTAEAQLKRGQALDALGRLDDALEALLDSALTAEGARRDDVAVSAWGRRLFLLAYYKGNSRDALREERHARVALGRLGGSPSHEAELENAVGVLHLRADGYAEARGHYERALALGEKVWGTHSVRIASFLNNLGSVYMGLQQFPEAQSALERSLRIREESLGKQHPAIAATLFNLADAARLTGQMEASASYIQRALELVRASQGSDHPVVATYLNGLGKLQYDRGQYAEALETHRSALELRRRKLGEQHDWIGYDLTGIGRALVALGRPKEALEPLEQALKLRDGKKLDPREMGETRFALAQALLRAGMDRRRASALLEQAREDFAKGKGRIVGSMQDVERVSAELAGSGADNGSATPGPQPGAVR